MCSAHLVLVIVADWWWAVRGLELRPERATVSDRHSVTRHRSQNHAAARNGQTSTNHLLAIQYYTYRYERRHTFPAA